MNTYEDDALKHLRNIIETAQSVTHLLGDKMSDSYMDDELLHSGIE